MSFPKHFNPDALVLMGDVCDDVWKQQRSLVFYPTVEDEQEARGEIAARVMAAVANGERDPVQLRKIALG
jgi:hypothetical protein